MIQGEQQHSPCSHSDRRREVTRLCEAPGAKASRERLDRDVGSVVERRAHPRGGCRQPVQREAIAGLVESDVGPIREVHECAARWNAGVSAPDCSYRGRVVVARSGPRRLAMQNADGTRLATRAAARAATTSRMTMRTDAVTSTSAGAFRRTLRNPSVDNEEADEPCLGRDDVSATGDCGRA